MKLYDRKTFGVRTCLYLLFISTILVFYSSPGYSGKNGGLVITEIMSHGPPNEGQPAIITRVHVEGQRSWIELYNPWADTVPLLSLRIASSKISEFDLDQSRLPPDGYRYLCNFAHCPKRLIQNNKRIVRLPKFSLEATDRVKVVSSGLLRSNVTSISSSTRLPSMARLKQQTQTQVSGRFNDIVARKVSTKTDGHPGFVPIVLQENNTIVRRTNQRGCVKDSQHSRSDFHKIAGQPDLGGYEHCGRTWPNEQNEYIEIYNASDRTIDPVTAGYRISDNLNGQGETVKKWYKIVKHPNFSIPNPFMTGTALEPGEAGLILPAGADTTTIYSLDQIRSSFTLIPQSKRDNGPDLIKLLFNRWSTNLYTTTSMNGKRKFLTGGFNNESQEHLRFYRPGRIPPILKIPEGGKAWHSYSVKPYEAWIKQNPTGSNDPSNWTKKPSGTPGIVN